MKRLIILAEDSLKKEEPQLILLFFDSGFLSYWVDLPLKSKVKKVERAWILMMSQSIVTGCE